MKRTILTLAASAALSLLAATETVLWPSDFAELKAQNDSHIKLLADGTMGVETGVKDNWPGTRLDFKAGTYDLTPFGQIVISVSNTTDRACQVHLSVKGGRQGSGPGGVVSLAPHQTGEIVASVRSLPWVLDAPLALEGMNGKPTARGGASAKGGGGFDLSKANSFHIFFCQDGQRRGFSVRRIVARRTGGEVQLLSAATFLPFVDKFGQFKHADWPGKIHNDAELAAAREKEKAWLAAHAKSPIPHVDKWGGWAAGPKLKATGFFRTEKVRGKWWLVDPDGRLFFSHGVDCVRVASESGVTFREKYFEWLPAADDPRFGAFWRDCKGPAAHGFYKDPAHLPYKAFSFAHANALRKYGPDWWKSYPDLVHARLRAWGLNTIANWSDAHIYLKDRTPYTICLGTWGAPRLKDSSGWWGALPDPFSPQFESSLRRQAQDAAKKMKGDPWCLGVFVDNELSWNREPRMAAVAEQYFSVVSKVLKEELPNHLYLGCRIAWGTDVIYRAAAKYCDVVSVNIYSHRPGRDLPSGAVDKPMINGEFHFGALDRGLFHTGLVATRNQQERAQCYRTYVNACLDHPRFVGTHWFQWQDQALTGRADGENYQIGFLTTTDTPYPELVEAARDIAAHMYERRFGRASKLSRPVK